MDAGSGTGTGPSTIEELEPQRIDVDRSDVIDRAAAVSPTIAGRYGRTRAAGRSRVRILIAVAAAFAVVLVAWVVWAGLDSSSSKLEAQNTAHTVVDDRTVEVVFDLSVPAGTPVTCAVEAMNDTFAIVGWKVVAYPASDVYTRTFTEELRTTQRASTGLISRCWLS